MGVSRGTIVDIDSVGVYHCVSRCVRRAFLCGWDDYLKKDFNYRRGWITGRMKELGKIFGVDIFAYAVMSNHFHLVIRTRPDRASKWSDEEVAQRWGRLFPGGRNKVGGEVEPDPDWLEKLLANPERLKVLRKRLGDVSWFMRCLNEWMARRANFEEECTGRFWEGRFKCQRLMDQGAVLACMNYVDLNRVRAKVAKGVEDSYFTSGYDRVMARKAVARLEQIGSLLNPTPEQQKEIDRQRNFIREAEWLTPFEPGNAERGALGSVSLDDYLELLEWTGKKVVDGKKGSLPQDLEPLLERLELDAIEWAANVRAYGSWFHRITGKVELMHAHARKKGQQWFWGVRGSEKFYQTPPPST